jgi:uncharacterized membrane-anchored protein
MIGRFSTALAALLALCMAISPAAAQTNPQDKVIAEQRAAWEAAKHAATSGPAQIKLGDQGSFQINADEAFIPAAEANRIMASLGNGTSPARYGLVVSPKKETNWIVDISWIEEGYVRDGDAKEWQPDQLLENLKDGTERGNAERIARGFPAIEVTGWIEKPAYDAANHRLVWSLGLRNKNGKPGEPQTVNYNTYALGRQGYFSLDLITSSDSIGTDKQAARDLLGSLNYGSGKRYTDFNGSTDKVAAYGLAALIGVVAVKKLGLLAMAGVFLLKIWKLGLIAIAAAGAAIRRFFRRKDNVIPAEIAPTTEGANAPPDSEQAPQS